MLSHAPHGVWLRQKPKMYGPYDLIHYEAYKDMSDAKRREKYLKTTKGKTTLKTMLKDYFNSN